MKRKRKGKSTQALMGIERFTQYGLSTARGELLFFEVAPTNISVLSPASIGIKTRHLKMVLSAIPDLEIICTDACQCFDDNKAYLAGRLETERDPKIRALLLQDTRMLDEMQAEMSTSRQFICVKRCGGLKPEQVFQTANSVAKALSDQGFEVRWMKKPEIKRFLAVYFGAGMNGDQMPDVDGAQYLAPSGAMEYEADGRTGNDPA